MSWKAQEDIGLTKQSEYLFDIDIKTIVVLDACRPDVFGELIGNYTNKTWQIVDSEACWTVPWYEKHWFGGRGKSVVLTTAHIMILKQRDIGERFYLINHVSKNIKGKNAWVRPEATLKKATTIPKKCHKLKHLIHIVPPHQPILSECGGVKYTEPKRRREKIYDSKYFEQAKKGYGENLIIALNSLFEYIDKLQKPLIVTSDHGEFIGETPEGQSWPVYAHKYKDDRLREVPLLLIRE